MKKFIITITLILLVLPRLSLAKDAIASPQDVFLMASREEAAINWRNPDDPEFSKTVIFSSTIPIEDYFSYQAVEKFCDKIYEGNGATTAARNLAPNLPYYFILFAADRTGNYSRAVVIGRDADLMDGEVVRVENNTDTIVGSGSDNGNNGVNANGTLAGASATVVNEVSYQEAEIVYNYNQEIAADPGSESRRLALFIIVKSPDELTDQDKNAIAYFIGQGTPTTILLGSGERTGVLNSYLSAFDKLPKSVLEWQDVIKIANGRWPDQRNPDAEERAATATFSAIYQRPADMDNAFDNAAVTVIAYGLRPAERNLESEKAAIRIYRSIFSRDPVEAYEWDMVRAIAYSGATR